MAGLVDYIGKGYVLEYRETPELEEQVRIYGCIEYLTSHNVKNLKAIKRELEIRNFKPPCENILIITHWEGKRTYLLRTVEHARTLVGNWRDGRERFHEFLKSDDSDIEFYTVGHLSHTFAKVK